MAQSSELGAGDVKILKEQYNDLRKDVLDPTLGHNHSGASDAGAKVVSLIYIPFFMRENHLYSQASAGNWEEIGSDQGLEWMVRFKLDCSRFHSNAKGKLHARIESGGQNSGSWARVRLYNLTDSTGYDYVEITQGESADYKISSEFDLPDSGVKEMTLQGATEEQLGSSQARVFKAILEIY